MKGDNLRSDVRSHLGIPRLHGDGYTSAITDRLVHGTQEPEKAAELEATLRATPWWPQLSSLNVGDLRTAWESTETNSELRRILEKFVWTDRETSARLRVRRDHK